MSTIDGWNGRLIFPAEIVRGAQRDPSATIFILRKTRTRLYLQASIPSMQIFIDKHIENENTN